MHMHTYKHTYKFLVEAQYEWNWSGLVGLHCVATVISAVSNAASSSNGE